MRAMSLFLEFWKAVIILQTPLIILEEPLQSTPQVDTFVSYLSCSKLKQRSLLSVFQFKCLFSLLL